MSKSYTSRLGRLYQEEQAKRESFAEREALNISRHVEFCISIREKLPFNVAITPQYAKEITNTANLKVLKSVLENTFGIVIEFETYYLKGEYSVRVIDFI